MLFQWSRCIAQNIICILVNHHVMYACHIAIPFTVCDGSDQSDPHTSATGAATAWEDPEVNPRSSLPIGSGLYPLDPGEFKGRVAELEGRADGRRGNIQEALEDPTRRLVRTQRMRRLLGPSGNPENRARPEQRIIAVPTRDEDCRPREADS
ncbi:hypothetical protein NDU88_001580 [Pleurodeles waltl]|uniref:Uncharacterized protein n=1 Tax=Pleurodeles waltl TaxID=8319 RepID=A0AAV7M3I4_PLEWA|nr:hypothetical protein NDU88_001580 [Pleurodeles waltl]